MSNVENNELFSPGSIIAERYEVLHSLGHGGVGAVLQVVDRHLDNEVCALKLLYPHLANDKIQFARFRNEVIIARKLSHPHIVRTYDFGRAGYSYYYISMEYVPGGNLSERIYSERHNRLTFTEILRILYEISTGLAYAHRQGVIHRDLKPDNILMTDRDEVKLSDFGLACSLLVNKGFTDTGETVGTPYYMAPEQLFGERPDPRVDIYSLGILAYEMVIGCRPFAHENYFELAQMHIHHPLPSMRSGESNIPRWFEQWVVTCAAKKKEDRFLTLDQAADVLRQHLDDSGNVSVKRGPAILALYNRSSWWISRTNPRLRQRVLTLVAMLCLIVVLSFWVMRENSFVNKSVTTMLLSVQGDDRSSPSLAQSLIGSSLTFSDFLGSVSSGSVEDVRSLITAGASPDTKDKAGTPALVFAVKANDERMVRLLLESGVNVNATDSNGMTSLMHASLFASRPIVAKLIDHGASLNFREKEQGHTALMLAVIENRVNLVEELLRKPAHINLSNFKGQTALVLAVIKGRKEIVSRLLAERRIDINKQDELGNSALLYALIDGDEKISSLLINANSIDFSARNNSGKNAASLASGRMLDLITQRSRNVRVTSKPSSRGNSSVESTRLRVMGRPRVSWTLRAGKLAHTITVSVRNVGESLASDISVVAISSSTGKEYILDGPDSLNRKEKQTYTARVSSETDRELRVKIRLSCTNCR